MSLRAILFDFDGVLADTEPLHFRAFREALAGCGIDLSRQEYDDEYLGLDDSGAFDAVFKKHRRPMAADLKKNLMAAKARHVMAALEATDFLRPEAVRFVRTHAARYYMAVVSGAFHAEVATCLERGGLLEPFRSLIGADDLKEGKPQPEGFLTAIRLLNRDWIPESEMLFARECLAVEDSPWGIAAARAAGIPCAALTTSYERSRLKGARWIVSDLGELNLQEISAQY